MKLNKRSIYLAMLIVVVVVGVFFVHDNMQTRGDLIEIDNFCKNIDIAKISKKYSINDNSNKTWESTNRARFSKFEYIYLNVTTRDDIAEQINMICDKQYDDVMVFNFDKFYIIGGIERKVEVGMLTSGDIVNILVIDNNSYDSVFIGKLILANRMNKKNNNKEATKRDIYKVLKKVLQENGKPLGA